MRRIRLRLQYDGSAYSGWQVQPSGITIQGVVQETILRLTGEKTVVAGSGRTDAGVHAIEQTAAFNLRSGMGIDVIKRGLNALLPRDIRITDAEEAGMDFNPRYDARRKRYFYVIANMTDMPAFVHKYVWQVRDPLSAEDMKTAAGFICGRHDFSSFRGAGCGANSPVRSVYSIEVERFHEAAFFFAGLNGNFMKIFIEADGFLRHMVRNIVGTLVEVGRKKICPEKMRDILDLRDRRFAGPTAPAKGLFLEKAVYEL